MTPLVWHCRHHRFTLTHRPLVMGVVNVTPDSFSDGGQFVDPQMAIDLGLKMIADGADILDVGGESTRPGATPVTEADELRRVIPVIGGLIRQNQDAVISVDTTKPKVARAAYDAGAAIINDVSGFRDPAMVRVATETDAGLVVMHMPGTPQTMNDDPQYHDIVAEVRDYLQHQVNQLIEAGVEGTRIAIDPGIGFGKFTDHSLTLLANLDAFQVIGRPLCLGISRKGFIGKITGRDTPDRMAGSLAVGCFAVAANSAQILRVHDVAPTRDAAVMWEAISQRRTPRTL